MIYRNEENGYTILRLETTDEGEEVTVVGTMPGVNPGEGLSVHGQWTRHSTYGEQFKAEIVERRMPVGEKALLEYLASGAIKASAPPPPGGCWTSLGRISSPSSRRTPSS